jgi:hypothetical protein
MWAGPAPHNTRFPTSAQCDRHILKGQQGMECEILRLSSPIAMLANRSGREVYGMNSLRPLQRWDRGFESHWRHGCLSAFILCRLRPCVGLIPRARNPFGPQYIASARTAQKKHRLQHFFYSCVRICYRKSVFTEPFPSKSTTSWDVALCSPLGSFLVV